MTEAQRLYLNRIQDSGHHLIRLIEHVFDLTKVDLGQTSYRPEETTVGSTLDEVALLLEPIAFKHDVTLAIAHDTARRRSSPIATSSAKAS